ncbi:MAG TPA: creatininase family protein [Thermomicrobiales bacterium]|nr:creatininase family protein [Thermomicrobiales bacterium]
MTLTIWNESTRGELNGALPVALVVLPTAAIEQHGPHLATGHDTFMVAHIARQAAERAAGQADVVLAPVLAFGSSAHHLPFGGTLSLRTETYLHVVRDLIESMLACGAKRILLLNGHGGNHELNQLAARDIAIELSPESGVVLSAASYWDIAREALAEDEVAGGLTLPGHAGQFETAMMLAFDPLRVRQRVERQADPSATDVVPGVRVETPDRWESFDGYTDFPHRATAEQGEVLLERVVGAVAEAMVALARR